MASRPIRLQGFSFWYFDIVHKLCVCGLTANQSLKDLFVMQLMRFDCEAEKVKRERVKQVVKSFILQKLVNGMT